MKIRNGYISNSSSSSFIITNKDNFDQVIELLDKVDEDYYILNDVMYTSFVYDCYSPEYSEIWDLSDDQINSSYSYPYNKDNFIEIEGTKGVSSVWLSKEILTDEDYRNLNKIPPIIKDRLCDYILDIVKYNKHKNANKEQLIEVLENCKQIIEGEINEG